MKALVFAVRLQRFCCEPSRSTAPTPATVGALSENPPAGGATAYDADERDAPVCAHVGDDCISTVANRKRHESGLREHKGANDIATPLRGAAEGRR